MAGLEPQHQEVVRRRARAQGRDVLGRGGRGARPGWRERRRQIHAPQEILAGIVRPTPAIHPWPVRRWRSRARAKRSSVARRWSTRRCSASEPDGRANIFAGPGSPPAEAACASPRCAPARACSPSFTCPSIRRTGRVAVGCAPAAPPGGARARVRLPILVLDEPTHRAHRRGQPMHLFRVVEKLKARGTDAAVLSLTGCRRSSLCDSITVMRDGAHVGTCPAPRSRRSRSSARWSARFPAAAEHAAAAAAAVLVVSRLSRRPSSATSASA